MKECFEDPTCYRGLLGESGGVSRWLVLGDL